MDEDKKMTAAISAVMQYLESEEETVDLLHPDETVSSLPPQNAWGMSGRQDQMQMRRMMTMKAFHRS
jgi:hypothetical protein